MDSALRSVREWQTVQIRKNTTCSVCHQPIYVRTGVVLRPPETSPVRATGIHATCLPMLSDRSAKQ